MAISESDPFEVVIIDDHEDACVVLSEVLAHRGFSVRWYTDASDALRALALQPADVVLTDVHMPGMSGVELARELRASARATQVVAISGIRGPDAEIAKHFDAYLTKPFDLALLPDVIRGVAQKARDARAARSR